MKKFFKILKLPLDPPEKKNRRKERLLLVLSGVLLGISFPPFPFPFQLLMFVGLIPLFIVIEKRDRLIAVNRAVYLTFFIVCLITLYWVGSWQETADPFLMISGVLLIFVNPVLFLIPSTLYYFARKYLNAAAAIFFMPFFWVAYEYAYMLTDLSFPWLTLGNGLSYFTYFIQAADIIGALGLSLVVVLINVLLYKAFHLRNQIKKAIIPKAAAVFIFGLMLAYGYFRINGYNISTEKIKVGIIQPDLDPWDKWASGGIDSMMKLYLDLSQKAVDGGAELLIWPETALPVYLFGGTYRSQVDELFSFIRQNNVYLLTGMPDVIFYDRDDPSIPSDAKSGNNDDFFYTTYNAILLLSPQTVNLQRYGKMKLVPFGERVPYVDVFPFLGDLIRWGVGITGWNVGKEKTIFTLPISNTNSDRDTLRINGLVCYESIYPAFVSEFINNGADLIVVVTNDSWYGKSSGPYQHKEIAVLRAIENRRTVIRAANGGVSCIINPLGITEVETELFTQTVFTADAVLQNEETFFTQNSLLVPIASSVISVWVFGIFLLKKIKAKFKL
jgi:apolipoprotein N-acyltransferase